MHRLSAVLCRSAETGCGPQTVRKNFSRRRLVATPPNGEKTAFVQAKGAFRRHPTTTDDAQMLAILFELYYDI